MDEQQPLAMYLAALLFSGTRGLAVVTTMGTLTVTASSSLVSNRL